MVKKQVDAKLSVSSYNFKKNASKDADMFAILSGEDSLGIVQFDEAEKVIFVEHGWTPPGKDRVSLFVSVYQAVKDIKRRAHKN